MKLTFKSILAYLLGVPILIFGVLALVTSVAGGIVLVIAGVVAVPKTRRMIGNKTGIEFSTGAAAGIPAILLLIGIVVLAMGTAGTTSAPGDDVSNVSINHENLSAENPDHQLHVTYNTRAQKAVNPNEDSFTHFESSDGQKYLVTRAEIENRGDQPVDLYGVFGLTVDGVTRDHQALGAGIGDVTLESGATHQGWLIYEIPEDATEGTLTTEETDLYYDGPIAITFEHDESMDIEMGT